MDNRDIIVIGGSSGATTPLKVFGVLPPDLPTVVFIVLHMPTRSIGILSTVASAAGSLPVHATVDGMAIKPGHVYLAVPNHHLIRTKWHIKLGRGRTCPALALISCSAPRPRPMVCG
jgi:two-component system chemotaxis response regulator CheB